MPRRSARLASKRKESKKNQLRTPLIGQENQANQGINQLFARFRELAMRQSPRSRSLSVRSLSVRSPTPSRSMSLSINSRSSGSRSRNRNRRGNGHR